VGTLGWSRKDRPSDYRSSHKNVSIVTVSAARENLNSHDSILLFGPPIHALHQAGALHLCLHLWPLYTRMTYRTIHQKVQRAWSNSEHCHGATVGATRESPHSHDLPGCLNKQADEALTIQLVRARSCRDGFRLGRRPPLSRFGHKQFGLGRRPPRRSHQACCSRKKQRRGTAQRHWQGKAQRLKCYSHAQSRACFPHQMRGQGHVRRQRRRSGGPGAKAPGPHVRAKFYAPRIQERRIFVSPRILDDPQSVPRETDAWENCDEISRRPTS
jgi:hypothetical protein